jgi:hypothetical protein
MFFLEFFRIYFHFFTSAAWIGSYPYQWYPVVVIASPVSGWMSGAWTAWIGSWPYQWYPVVVIANPVSGWISGAWAAYIGSYPYQW